MDRRSVLSGVGTVIGLAGCLGVGMGRSPFEPPDGNDPTARLDWAGDYVSPNGFRVRVGRPRIQPTYRYRDRSMSLRRRAPPSGGKWVFVTLWAKNESDEIEYAPEVPDFTLAAGNHRMEAAYPVPEPSKQGLSYRDDGGCTCKRGELMPGSVQDGWIAFVVPAGFGPRDVTIVWDEVYPTGTRISVVWSE